MTASVLLRYGMKEKLFTEPGWNNQPTWFVEDMFKGAETDPRTVGAITRYLAGVNMPSKTCSMETGTTMNYWALPSDQQSQQIPVSSDSESFDFHSQTHKGELHAISSDSKPELRRVGWRRDSVPALETTIAGGMPLKMLQRYVLESQCGNSSFNQALKAPNAYYNHVEQLVLGLSESNISQLNFSQVIQDPMEDNLAAPENYWMWRNSTDLNGDVNRARQAVQATTDEHPDRGTWLLRFGTRLIKRYEFENNATDLEEALSVCRQAVQSTPENHHSRHTWLNTYVDCLEKRYTETSDPTFLDEAIDMSRQALKIASRNHDLFTEFDKTNDESDVPLASQLRDLATLLKRRYKHTRKGSLSDLNEVIDLGRQIINAGTVSSPEYGVDLEELGINLIRQYKRTKNPIDLDESIDFGKRSFEFFAAGPSEYYNSDIMLRNLGDRLAWRYPERYHVEDDKGAIFCARLFLKRF
ncbi:hypothetical protein V491_04689 [Pseudogymnoascus sp. VKM F-3775]|nr:hypothetical protein V491_04689 [Pseudogymnoascus sp. VKM F-3775]